MAIVRWDPFRTLMRWPSIWDEEDWGTPTTTADQLDIYETDNEVVIRANIAGVPEDKVDLTFERGILTISAEETEETAEGKKYYQRASRRYSYRVAVPGNIDSKTEPQAHVDQGVVEVRFQKAAEAKPKKISVRKRGK